MVKISRQQAIEQIISNEDICTQEELQKKLCEAGFEVTQATVSRDIKAMGLVKVLSSNGKYRYDKSFDKALQTQSEKFRSVFLEAVISVDYAQNIAVLKCHTGMGNAACAALDRMELGEVVGTLAGDDTIFILLRTTEAAVVFTHKIKKILGN